MLFFYRKQFFCGNGGTEFSGNFSSESESESDNRHQTSAALAISSIISSSNSISSKE
jgi:hypothetical protein